MKIDWKVVYYEAENSKSPVEEFINSRTKRNQAKVLSYVSLFQDNGPNLTRPYADLLEDGIHELRIKLSGDQIRILYFFCFRNLSVSTHAFPKTTDKVPKAEITKAKKYRDDFLKRFAKE